MFENPKILVLILYISYLALMSILAIFTYFKDKKLAKKGKERIKEKTLLEITVFGGAIGSEIGRRLARHKTNKLYFSLVIYLSIILQLAVLVTLIVIGGVK